MDRVQGGVDWRGLRKTMEVFVAEYVGKIRRIGEINDIENGTVTLATVHRQLLLHLISLLFFFLFCTVARSHAGRQSLAEWSPPTPTSTLRFLADSHATLNLTQPRETTR